MVISGSIGSPLLAEWGISGCSGLDSILGGGGVLSSVARAGKARKILSIRIKRRMADSFQVMYELNYLIIVFSYLLD
jgi:hypothetical protein